MAIKRVVDKPKQKTVKTFPEFDMSKIYIYQHEGDNEFSRILRDGHNNFTLQELEGSCLRGSYTSFTELCKTIVNPIYILDNQQDLARFILGCREFPTVQEIEEIINEPLADDEVSVEDLNFNKIYALLKESSCCTLKKYNDGSFTFHSIFDSTTDYLCTYAYSMKDSIQKALSLNDKVYQFDTQEEFLRWSLEQVTGKSVYIGDRVLETKTTPTLNYKALDVLIDFYVEHNAEKERGCSVLPVRTEINCFGVNCYSQGCQSLCKKALKAGILEAV